MQNIPTTSSDPGSDTATDVLGGILRAGRELLGAPTQIRDDAHSALQALERLVGELIYWVRFSAIAFSVCVVLYTVIRLRARYRERLEREQARIDQLEQTKATNRLAAAIEHLAGAQPRG